MGGNGIRSKSVSNMIIRECILCGLVYLAPARCAHEILLNLITHKSALTKVLRNQLPPLRSSALQSPPTMLSLNLNEWSEEIFGRQFTSIKKTIIDNS